MPAWKNERPNNANSIKRPHAPPERLVERPEGLRGVPGLARHDAAVAGARRHAQRQAALDLRIIIRTFAHHEVVESAGAYGMPTVTTRRQASSLYEMPSEHLPRYTQNNKPSRAAPTALL